MATRQKITNKQLVICEDFLTGRNFGGANNDERFSKRTETVCNEVAERLKVNIENKKNPMLNHPEFEAVLGETCLKYGVCPIRIKKILKR